MHDVETVHLGRAAVGQQERGEDAHRGGLPGAVGAEQAQHGARLDLEVDALQGLDVAEMAFESLGADDGTVGHEDRAYRLSEKRSALRPGGLAWAPLLLPHAEDQVVDGVRSKDDHKDHEGEEEPSISKRKDLLKCHDNLPSLR